MNFKILTTTILLGISSLVFSQEFVTGIQINEAVVLEAKKIALEIILVIAVLTGM